MGHLIRMQVAFLRWRIANAHGYRLHMLYNKDRHLENTNTTKYDPKVPNDLFILFMNH